jgi:hypothetical protein
VDAAAAAAAIGTDKIVHPALLLFQRINNTKENDATLCDRREPNSYAFSFVVDS